MNKVITLLFILVLCIQCNTKVNPDSVNKPHGVIAKKAMVVSARQEASKIGVDIMKQGGNAFDAMIATDLALLVSYPVAGNILPVTNFLSKNVLSLPMHPYLKEDDIIHITTNINDLVKNN